MYLKKFKLTLTTVDYQQTMNFIRLGHCYVIVFNEINLFRTWNVLLWSILQWSSTIPIYINVFYFVYTSLARNTGHHQHGSSIDTLLLNVLSWLPVIRSEVAYRSMHELLRRPIQNNAWTKKHKGYLTSVLYRITQKKPHCLNERLCNRYHEKKPASSLNPRKTFYVQ